MSILIKGMEMPKNCWLCPLSDLYEKPREMLMCKILKEEVLRYKIDSNCPLVEIPPHGRLIDADVLSKKMRGVVFRGEEKDVLHHNVQVFLDAPTIIEAEEGE